MKSKLLKVAGLTDQDSGVGFYRIAQPLSFLKREGFAYEVATNPLGGIHQKSRISQGQDKEVPVWSDRTLMRMTKDADVILTTVYTDLNEISKILNLRHWSGAKWVVDMDDDLYHIPTTNPAKASNDRVRNIWEKFLKIADGLTVSVPMLKKMYQHLNDNIYVNPNGFDFDEIWNFPNEKNKTRKIRIGWRGALGHRGDLRTIEQIIDSIKKDYDVTFVTLGAEPPFPTEHHKWFNLPEFPKGLANLGLDIAVFPLIDNDYNKCKSAIAIGEYSALKIPVVASPTENQKDIEGVLYANTPYEWYDALENLILDKKLRIKNGQKQYDFIKKNYNMKVFTPPLAKWFKELPRKKDLKK